MPLEALPTEGVFWTVCCLAHFLVGFPGLVYYTASNFNNEKQDFPLVALSVVSGCILGVHWIFPGRNPCVVFCRLASFRNTRFLLG